MSWHQDVWALTSSLYAVSSPSVIRPMTVVSSANLTMTLELFVATQSCVNREKKRGLSTQPCGAPVLRVRVEDVAFPLRSAWCLPVRKLRIQSQRAVLSPRSLSFTASLEGTMVLNAEM